MNLSLTAAALITASVASCYAKPSEAQEWPVALVITGYGDENQVLFTETSNRFSSFTDCLNASQKYQTLNGIEGAIQVNGEPVMSFQISCVGAA